MDFISQDLFEEKSTERDIERKIYTWHELPVDNTIYKVVNVELRESSFPGKSNAILTCESREIDKPIRVWAPSLLLEEIQENSRKTAFFRTHGCTVNVKNGRSRFEYSLAFQ